VSLTSDHEMQDKDRHAQVDIEAGDAFGLGHEHVSRVRKHLKSGDDEALKAKTDEFKKRFDAG